jgi:hypothetical protein
MIALTETASGQAVGHDPWPGRSTAIVPRPCAAGAGGQPGSIQSSSALRVNPWMSSTGTFAREGMDGEFEIVTHVHPCLVDVALQGFDGLTTRNSSVHTSILVGHIGSTSARDLPESVKNCRDLSSRSEHADDLLPGSRLYLNRPEPGWEYH